MILSIGIIINIVKSESVAQSHELLLRIEGIEHDMVAKNWKKSFSRCSENLYHHTLSPHCEATVVGILSSNIFICYSHLTAAEHLENTHIGLQWRYCGCNL